MVKGSRPRLTQAALAAALDLSPARVTALKRQGMPVDSIEAAHAWREQNVGPYLRGPIASRAGGRWYHPPQPDYDRAAELDPPERDREADAGDAFLALALVAHRDLERYRHALAHVWLVVAVSDEQRERVHACGLVTQRVWDALDAALMELRQ